ncbi:MAG TPA: hypothetical protein VFW20_10440 [Candidatus Limnocylindrales bacterium]|nr:hypothetical protein [Candidatus Limnocylindrales bacterium]
MRTPTTGDEASEPRLPALVFGKNNTALGALRSLAGHGVPTLVAEETGDLISRSRLYARPPRTLRETSDSTVLAAYLDDLPIERAVLIPGADGWAGAISGLPARLAERFPASVPPHTATDRLLEKSRFRELVEELGIPHPRTRTLRTLDDLDGLDELMLAGAFLKPTESQRHNAAFGTKGLFVQTLEAARRRVGEGAAAGITFMLQEWIPGGMGNTVLLDGFIDRTGTIRAMTARRRLRMNPQRLGNTTAAVTIPMSEVAPAAEALRTVLAAVGYRGVFNAEFKLDDRDGTFRIIEVNPRPAWYSGSLRGAGVDLIWMSYLDALGLPVPTVARYRLGRYGVCETPDAISIVRTLAARERPPGPILRPWLTGDHVLFAWSDPAPFLADLARSARGFLRARRAAAAA